MRVCACVCVCVCVCVRAHVRNRIEVSRAFNQHIRKAVRPMTQLILFSGCCGQDIHLSEEGY